MGLTGSGGPACWRTSGVGNAPYGLRRGGWPKVPPNYIAFRWDGHVRRIHHIDAYAVVDDLHEAFDEIPAGLEADVPHIVYDLGPPILPALAPPDRRELPGRSGLGRARPPAHVGHDARSRREYNARRRSPWPPRLALTWAKK